MLNFWVLKVLFVEVNEEVVSCHTACQQSGSVHDNK